MTPLESCGWADVSVISSHHVIQSQQQLVLPARPPPNAICPNPWLWLAPIRNALLLTQLAEAKVSRDESGKPPTASSPHVYMLNNLNYNCEGGAFSLFLYRGVKLENMPAPVNSSICFSGCLMRAGWKMENVPSVVCLMAGFLSSHHAAEVPR